MGYSVRGTLAIYSRDMTRALAIAAVLLALSGVYLVYKSMTRVVPTTEVAEERKEVAQVRSETIKENAATYTIDAKYPQFGIPAIDGKIKERIELAIAQFKQDTADGPPVPDSAVQQYEFASTFDSTYVGADIVSARMITSTYMGGAHPMSIVNGVNFDRNTGRELTPRDAYEMVGLSLGEIATKAKAELQAKLGGDIIAPEGADPSINNYSTFVIDANSVTFIFQVYQVAPYAAGPQEIVFKRQP
jgi:peptidoglycan-N-acetylglucosamine deacetylase